MGLSYSRPAVVRLRNGQWAAVFGNGYNSVNGKAVLYIVNIANGSIISKIDTGVGAGGNGLSTPALGVDLKAIPSWISPTPATSWATCGSST